MKILTREEVEVAIRKAIKKSKKQDCRIQVHLDSGAMCIYWVGERSTHKPEQIARMYDGRITEVTRGEE